ncbi:MAG: indole-3-glycerol phosphate synthase TrpC [Deltaproteobacteria bacterium TMED58]|nr:indole-3-glycerol phosphate synthase TrpC [Deltaproteobacteria bacterium TMED58]
MNHFWKKKTTNIIAEIKKASPSKGIILEDFQPLKIALEYELGGASAISILTDEPFFKGKIDYIPSVRMITKIPLLRKDFIIDEYQIIQSRFYEADAILLIGRVLSQSKLNKLFKLATEYNLDVLYEAHNEEDLDKGVSAGVKIFGINNRDLSTFKVSNKNILDLHNKIPVDSILVSESGITKSEDIADLKKEGINNFLIGESIMKASDRVEFIQELIKS